MNDGDSLSPELQQAHQRLAKEVFARIKQTGDPGELPDTATFLREAGVNPGDIGPVFIQYTDQPADEKPEVVEVECPGGGRGKGYFECEVIKGERHCVWVSTCP